MRGFGLLLPAVISVCMISAVSAEEIGWQEAVARLATERTNAETCVRALKSYGDRAAVKHGEVAYGEAKAEYDGIIKGLTVALARNGEPASLPDLETRMQRGFDAREALCKKVQDLVPSSAGQKTVLTDILTGGVGKALIDAVLAIYMRSKDDDALMRKTIENQLEAAIWPQFAAISP